MPLPSIIAVDGPAGSGKSAVSFAVAQRLNYLFVDTGAFYRAVTILALQHNVDPGDAAQTTRLTQQAHFDMTPPTPQDIDGRQFTLMAGDQDLTARLHTPEVDAHVSTIAATPGVRAALLDLQRRIAGRGRVIMAGRDIGTVVLPDADLKLYIDASLHERARRRFEQRLREKKNADRDQIERGLAQRDERDSTRSVSPLQIADDAIYVDTSQLDLTQAIQTVLDIIHRWQPRE